MHVLFPLVSVRAITRTRGHAGPLLVRRIRIQRNRGDANQKPRDIRPLVEQAVGQQGEDSHSFGGRDGRFTQGSYYDEHKERQAQRAPAWRSSRRTCCARRLGKDIGIRVTQGCRPEHRADQPLRRPTSGCGELLGPVVDAPFEGPGRAGRRRSTAPVSEQPRPRQSRPLQRQ